MQQPQTMTAYNDDKYYAGQWYKCNDSSKTKCDDSKITRWMNSAGDPTPYQCVYYKVNSIAPPSSIVIPSFPMTNDS